MKFSRAPAESFAAGFPATSAIDAIRLRARGDLLRGTGPVMLRNGTNSFTIDVSAFTSLSVCADAATPEIHAIVGRKSLTDENGEVLARFGSQAAATNAHAKLLRAHAGFSCGGGSRAALKVGAAVVGVLVFTLLFGMVSVATQQGTAVAGAAPDLFAPQRSAQTAPFALARGAGDGSQFNPSEATLEDLAAGKYQFNPKLQAPDVQIPSLECAQPRDARK